MSDRYSKEDLRHIAEDLIENLRECDDGTVTTTGMLADASGYNDLDIYDLLDLHNNLVKTARANHVTLNMSGDEDGTEDLPFNRTFIVKNRMAQIKCPRCGSRNTARYIYGYPIYDEEMLQMLDSGKWVLGGCCISSIEVNGRVVDIMPKRKCNDCGKDFAAEPLLIRPQNGSAEDYRDIITGIKFSIGGYFGGFTDITIRKNNKGAFVRVRKTLEPEVLEVRQIRPEKWMRIVNALYGRMYLHEWKKNYDNPEVLDGTQWELDISLTRNRKRTYYGSNAYPPYWRELLKLFREYSKGLGSGL